MRIAHFTNTYLPNVNGVSRSVSTFREALTRLGHTVFVFAPGAGDYQDEVPYIFRYPAFELKQFNYSISVPVSRQVNWVLPRLKPHVIHSNHPVLLGDIAARRAQKLGVPLVFTFHTRYTEYSHYVPLSQDFVKGVTVEGLVRYLRRCQHIVTPSDSIRNMLVDNGITERVTTIPTGIDLQPYQRADGREIRNRFGWRDQTVIVSLGRLAEEKNWKTLLQACAYVISERQDVRLMLVGDGPQRKELEIYASELGISQQVVFIGRVPFEQVPDYLKAGDLFCYASTTETQGLVTMEAMAAGLPVVAVEATGTSDVVDDGVQGILTEDDPQALAEGLRIAISNSELRGKLRLNLHAKVEQFDMMVQARRMLDVYDRAIEDKKAGKAVKVDSLTGT
ncbi:MAG: glycosyltransferase family 4 protein [Chloroflexota bacterium]|nr:glycosyltransferase family 4 protein [Chloroflexota bacterium]